MPTERAPSVRPPAVTVEQHREMVRYGVKWREDETWGFKKKCARAECDKVVETSCYCSPDLAEALRQAKEGRSGYTCSDECFILSGWAEDAAEGFVSEGELNEFISAARLKRHRIDLRRSGWLKTAYGFPTLRKSVLEFVQHVMTESDWDGDEEECSCEI